MNSYKIYLNNNDIDIFLEYCHKNKIHITSISCFAGDYFVLYQSKVRVCRGDYHG